MSKFEQYNEMVFEAYCKKSIVNAVNKEREKKAARGRIEQSLSSMTDAELCALAAECDAPCRAEELCRTFKVRDMEISVYDPKLGAALSYLMPKDREIVLLYYFERLKDAKIAPLVHMSRAAVSRRRKAAVKRLRKLMEDSI